MCMHGSHESQRRRNSRIRCPLWTFSRTRVRRGNGAVVWVLTAIDTGTSWADEMDELPSAREYRTWICVHILNTPFSRASRHQG